jgi:hypothetical protein
MITIRLDGSSLSVRRVQLTPPLISDRLALGIIPRCTLRTSCRPAVIDDQEATMCFNCFSASIGSGTRPLKILALTYNDLA